MSGWYGSLQNRLYERTRSSEPKVGMGATEILWSDRRAYEVIAVKDERHCTVRKLRAVNMAVYPEQEYRLESDECLWTKELFRTKEGKWVSRIGRQYDGNFILGWADEYEDPSF